MHPKKPVIYTKLRNKEKLLSLIGIGYVGLSIALEFARKFNVIGFDINPKRVELMQNHIGPDNELRPKKSKLSFSCSSPKTGY